MTSARITHVGGPTVLLEVGDRRILTDPTFDSPGRHYSFGWGSGSDKLAGPALDAASLGPLDAVLVTHDHHADNLDDAGRDLLPSAGAVVTTVSGAERLGNGAHGLRPWDRWVLSGTGDDPDIEVTATPCRHGPPGSRPVVGDVVGFALQWDGQSRGALWFSGDTVLYGGVRQVADRLDVGTAVLHLGGVRFPITGPVRYTMTAADGVELCRSLRPDVVIPVHYEGWSHFADGRAELDQAIAAAPPEVAASFRILPLGVPTEVDV